MTIRLPQDVTMIKGSRALVQGGPGEKSDSEARGGGATTGGEEEYWGKEDFT